jgi:hypothetical protein
MVLLFIELFPVMVTLQHPYRTRCRPKTLPSMGEFSTSRMASVFGQPVELSGVLHADSKDLARISVILSPPLGR